MTLLLAVNNLFGLLWLTLLLTFIKHEEIFFGFAAVVYLRPIIFFSDGEWSIAKNVALNIIVTCGAIAYFIIYKFKNSYFTIAIIFVYFVTLKSFTSKIERFGHVTDGYPNQFLFEPSRRKSLILGANF